jgi:hypothetical protein
MSSSRWRRLWFRAAHEPTGPPQATAAGAAVDTATTPDAAPTEGEGTAQPGSDRTTTPPHGHLAELTTRAWREEALSRADEIKALSQWICDLPRTCRGISDDKADRHIAESIDRHVAAVISAAQSGGPLMRNGARLGRVATHLHAAEADLLRRAPSTYVRGEVPSLEAHVRRHLPVDDPRRVRMEAIARKVTDRWPADRSATDGKATDGTAKDPAAGPGLDQEDRETIIAVVRAASSAAEREQQRIRSFRTIVAVATVLLTVIAGLVALLGALKPTLMPICFTPQPTPPDQQTVVVCPTGRSPLDGDVDDVIAGTVDAWDIPLIEIVGVVAAGVTGALALRRLRGSSSPFGVPVALIALKLPTGALTALLGLLLMRGGFVPGLSALDTSPQILAWAVVFGGSQQLFTGLVDRQAQTVLDAAGGKTYTATGGS